MSDLALLQGAVWIGSEHPFDVHEAYLCFRREWRPDRKPKRAELLITADSRYKLWVNGQFVARGPARSYPDTQCVDQLDITPHIQLGRNVLAAQVYQPGYSHFAYLHRGAAGLLAWLLCDGQTALTTDSDWRTRRDPSFAEWVRRISIYGSGVEERELSLDDGWQDPAFHDLGWARARVVAPIGGYPWTSLQLRPLPMLAEREAPMTLLETRRGSYPVDYCLDAHLELRQGWAGALSYLTQTDAGDLHTPDLAEGESAYWLFDLGRDYTGQGWAEVEGAVGQERLSVSYAEKIRHGELVLSDPQTYCRVRMTDRFRLRQGNQSAESFALRGGRYLLFQVTGPTGPGFRLRFHARVAEYPLHVSRELNVADPVLNKVITLCEETLRACLLDGFLDSPWRESAQWVGDALPEALIMAAMSDDLRPLKRVIELAAQGAYGDGVLPSVFPAEAHAYTIVDYNFMWVELLSLYRTLGGDEDFVATMWPALVKMMHRFHRDLNPSGLIVSQPGRRLFLDWAPLSRNEPNAVYNLHYLLALRTAGRMAYERGETEQADCWQARAAALREAVRSAFWRERIWYDDERRTTFSQLAAALAILSEATCPEEVAGLLEAIADRSLNPDDKAAPGRMVLASPFTHHYIFEALRKGGKSEQVLEVIRRRWGRWVQAGYPTAWENWNVDFPDGSQCHAFSAHPRYHMAEIFREQEGGPFP